MIDNPNKAKDASSPGLEMVKEICPVFTRAQAAKEKLPTKPLKVANIKSSALDKVQLVKLQDEDRSLDKTF